MKGTALMKELTTTATLLVLSVALGACAGGADTADETTIQEASGTATNRGSHTGLLNPNLASEQELLALEGISAGALSVIIDGRPFVDMVSLDTTLDRLLKAEVRENLYEYMWIPMNLNTMSDEEILRIPGVGDRMLHEFKEYQPYTSMEQFEREIGKYVNDAELARLSHYVTLDEN